MMTITEVAEAQAHFLVESSLLIEFFREKLMG